MLICFNIILFLIFLLCTHICIQTLEFIELAIQLFCHIIAYSTIDVDLIGSLL